MFLYIRVLSYVVVNLECAFCCVCLLCCVVCLDRLLVFVLMFKTNYYCVWLVMCVCCFCLFLFRFFYVYKSINSCTHEYRYIGFVVFGFVRPGLLSVLYIVCSSCVCFVLFWYVYITLCLSRFCVSCCHCCCVLVCCVCLKFCLLCCPFNGFVLIS